jgi:hypothetical protein
MKMDFAGVVKKYRDLAGDFGTAVSLSDYNFPRANAEKFFSDLNDDYQISRFLHFQNREAENFPVFQISGFPQTHVTLHAEIESLL